MLRKRKKQLRYAADQIIENPRRDRDDDSHLDVVHLKRRNIPERQRSNSRKSVPNHASEKHDLDTGSGRPDADGTIVEKDRRDSDNLRSQKKSTVDSEHGKVSDIAAEYSRRDGTGDRWTPKAESKETESRAEFLLKMAEVSALDSTDTDSKKTEKNVDPVSVATELPHPDDATHVFDELDELLLAEEDKELEAAIRRRLNEQKLAEMRNRAKENEENSERAGNQPVPDKAAQQRLTQLEAEREQARTEVDRLKDIAAAAEKERAEIQQQADQNRREVIRAREEQARIREQAAKDRELAEQTRKDQAVISVRAKQERSELKQAIESVREKARKAEVERLKILQEIESERKQLTEKLDEERELTRKAEAERKDFQEKTEQQRAAVKAALTQQQDEAQRLELEAARLEMEAKSLESERLEIQRKAQNERDEVQKLLDEEREQVRQVGQKWAEIQQRASSEREKIRQLVETDNVTQPQQTTPTTLESDSAAKPATPHSVTQEREPTITPVSTSSAAPAANRSAVSNPNADELVYKEKQERSLREKALREQSRIDSTVGRRNSQQTESFDNRTVRSNGSVSAGVASVPTANKFTDTSGTAQSDVASKSPSIKNETKLPGKDARTETKTDSRSESEAVGNRLEDSKTKTRPDHKTASGGESIPVLKSSASAASASSRPVSRLPSAAGMRFLAVGLSVFVTVFLISSLAFFGYLKLDNHLNTNVTDNRVGTQQSDGVSAVEGFKEKFTGLRQRVFGGDESDGEAQAATSDVDSDLNKTQLVAENAPATEPEFSELREDSENLQQIPDIAAEADDVLRGRVVVDSGDAIEGVTVTAIARKYFIDPKGSSGGVNYRTRTDADGVFSLRVPPGEEYRLVTEGTAEVAPTSAYLTPGADAIDIKVDALNGALSVTGRIFTDALDPIGSAKATTQFDPVQEVYSDDDGVYSIKVDPPQGGSDDTLVLRFEAAGFHDGIMHLPANVWKEGKSISHDVFLDAL